MACLLVHHLPLLLVGMLALQCRAVSGLFDWLKGTQAPPAAPKPAAPQPPAGDTPPFEMTVTDEKFLAEAKQMELSPLDSCHYRVVAQLKSTCESLSEEQLAKLGVTLFNCQAQVEGRRTFRCTEDMTIKQCTKEMDSDTWNAYHIVSNRARSVCYATRQQHFRRRAELTVNALISTATTQLDAMKDLKEGQLELRELTAASLDKLLKGHSALQAQQGKLWEGQEQMEHSLTANLERLSQEKALIASGQELVAQLIQGITKRMENVSEHLKSQGTEVQDSHKAIIEDLADVRDRAQDIYQKIDHSMLGFLQYQDQTAQYYSDLMSKLERMNGTLGIMLHYLDNMQSRVEERLQMIQGYLGWAGHWFVNQLLWAGSQIRGKPASLPPLSESTPQRNKVDDIMEQEDLLNHDSFLSGDPDILAWSPSHSHPVPQDRFVPIMGTPNQSTPRLIGQQRLSAAVIDDIPLRNLGGVFDAVNDSRCPSPNLSLASNSSLSGRQLCNGITKTGKACKKRALLGQEYCRVHEGGYTSYINT